MQNESFFFFFVSFCCVVYYFYITLQRFFMVFVCRFLSCLLLLSCLGMINITK